MLRQMSIWILVGIEDNMLIKNTSILKNCPLACVSTSLMNNLWTIMFPSDYLGHGDEWGLAN